MHIKIDSKKLAWIFLGVIFLSMLVLNYYTPLIADDFSYSYDFSGNKIKTIGEIISYQYQHYFLWGGRSIAHTVGQIFLLLGKNIFTIVNTFVYTTMIYLMYKLTIKTKDNPYLILVIHFLIYFSLPVFGQNCLWLIGSSNYLWTTTFILYILNIYKNNEKRDCLLKNILLFLGGVIAGWTNENTSAGLIMLLLALLAFEYFNKEKIYRWKLSGLAGVVLGFLIMVLAPGNFIRKNTFFVDERSLIVKVIERGLHASVKGINIMLPLIALLIILISLYLYNKKKINNLVYVYLVGSFFAIYTMVLSPTFPDRSWIGPIVFMILAINVLLGELKISDKSLKLFKYIYFNILILVSLFFISDYAFLAKNIKSLQDTWKYRDTYLKNMKQKDVQIKKYYTNNKKNPMYGLADFSSNKDEWPNTAVCNYYELKSIVGVDN